MELKQFLKDIPKIQKELPDIINKAIIEGKVLLIKSIQEQLAAGKTPDNHLILRTTTKSNQYSKGYKSLKKSKGLQYNYVDLKYSGDFYRSIKEVVKSKLHYDFTSDISYWSEINQYYGDNLGLTNENLNMFSEKYLLPIILKYINNKLA